MLSSDTVVEVQDTTARENYNKVVIHKRKCVPYVALPLPSNGRVISSGGNNNRYSPTSVQVFCLCVRAEWMIKNNVS